ncbi:hypothetical protein FQR65_LT11913 [Abscondita terminalis]|nr:hypothetical protein FQR65_LT11913 [Abscondita terminalis]
MHNIAIIGCGIVGLTTATVIQDKFKSSVTIYTEKLSPNTTSDIAAGLWGPYTVLDTKLEKITKWGKDTHDYFLNLWRSGCASEAGITLLMVRDLQTGDVDKSLDKKISFMVYKKFPNTKLENINKDTIKITSMCFRIGFHYVTFTCEPQIHLPFLEKKFISNGGVIKIQKIADISELSGYDLVINCSGLNGKFLCDDDKVVPIRGQIAKLHANTCSFHYTITMHNIAIIGCGIVGLTTATVIQNKFKSSVRITIYTEKLSPNTTSDIAAGLWGPYTVLDTKLEKITKWGKDTHDYFLNLWRSGCASEAGITLLMVRDLQTGDVDKSLDKKNIVYGLQEIPQHQIREYQQRHNKNYKIGFHYVTFTCEPQIHLPFLEKKFISNGGVIKIQKIADISELSGYDLVINCSGLNGKFLCDDDKVVPIRGQIAKARAPWQFHASFSDGSYIIPNFNNIVMGGTTQMGDWETNPRESDQDNILNGVYNILPPLKNARIFDHKVGLRPGRSEVRLELEMSKIHGKQLPIIHNYGHGGAGVTFAYGCALETLDLIEQVFVTCKLCPTHYMITMHNIAIIGCGVVGLTTATIIQDKLKSSVRITIYTEKLSPNTTSDVAAGLWGPSAILNTKLEKIIKWGKATHNYLLELWKRGYASDAGIALLMVRELQTSERYNSSDIENIVYGFQKIADDQIKQYRRKHNKNYKIGFHYVTFTCEPQIHLPFLEKKFISNGGVIKIQKIADISELSGYDLVINCSGLNGKFLCDDDEMVPIRGQIAKARAPWQFHASLTDSIYIIPNFHNVVMGGTKQVDDWETNPRESDRNNIVNGVYTILPTLKNTPIFDHKVGLRPGRSEVRLELEMRKVHGKRLPVIHNYGHGGAGVTFSYGCALETLELLEEVFGRSIKSKL